MEEAIKAVAGLSATIFSPAKMVYIAYVLLTVLRLPTHQPSWWCFGAVSVLFFIAEIGHNDWLRIRLNNSAERNRPEWLRPK
jgi:hypothetical protein